MISPTVNATPSVTVRFPSMETWQKAQGGSCRARRRAKRSIETVPDTARG
jgi:hypothetical protein